MMKTALLRTIVCSLLLGCSADGPSPQPHPSSPSNPPPAEQPRAAPEAKPQEPAVSPGVTERLRIDLYVDKPVAIPGVDATATLLTAERRRHRAPDGTTYDSVGGRVRFTRGETSSELDFTEGQAFEQYGYRMAIFGSESDLVLSVFPPGEPVRP